MRSDLQTYSRSIKNIVNTQAQMRVRSAMLLDTYLAGAREVLIQLGDPKLGRGAVIRASVQPGTVAGNLVAGTPVSVVCRHGHYEVIGMRGS